MKYKMIFTDVDGTLLSDDHIVSEKTKLAIHKAIFEKNIFFVLCSGRSNISLHTIEEELDLGGKNLYGICFNGAMIYEIDTKKQIFFEKLNSKDYKSIINVLKKFDTTILVHSNDQVFTENYDDFVINYEKNSSLKTTKIENFDNISDDVSKVIMLGSNEKLQTIKSACQVDLCNKANIFFSCDTILEFININSNKGNAIKFLTNYLDIDLEDVISVGDNYNDIEMIGISGVGVAVKNAVDDLKKIACYTTLNDNNNDALYEVINKFIFNNSL